MSNSLDERFNPKTNITKDINPSSVNNIIFVPLLVVVFTFLSKEDMTRLLSNRGVSGDSEIITYCGSVGTLSGLAYYALKSAGLPNAKLYVRSFKEWKNLQKPTETQEDANYWDLSAE